MDNPGNIHPEEEFQRELENSQGDKKLLSALLTASRSVFESRKFSQTARSIFNCCKKITGATAGYVALLSTDGSENEVLFLDSGGINCTVNLDLPMPIRGLRAEAYHSGKVVYDNDFAASTWMRYLPAGHSPLNNVLFAPLLIDGKAVGLIGLANKPSGFTEKDAGTVTIFAQLASISLLNARNIEALEKSEQLFRELFRNMKGGGAIYTAENDGQDFIIVDYHPPSDRLGETLPDDKIGKSVLEVFPGAKDYGLFKVLQQVWRTGKAEYHPVTSYDDDKITLWRENYVYKLPSGEIVALYDDLTERKQLEEALKEREELFRTVFETSPDAININRIRDGLFVKINHGFTALTGYTEKDVIGKTVFDIKIWRNVKRRTELMALLEREGEVQNFEAAFRMKDGRIVPGLISARLIHLHSEPHVLAVSRDISAMKKAEQIRKKHRQDLERRVAERTAELAATNRLLRQQIKERMHAEAALIESEKMYSRLVESSLTGIYISQAGKIAFANDRFAEMHGYSRQELLDMDTLQLVHPDDRDRVRKFRAERLQDKPVPAEYEIRGLRKDGGVIWVTRRNTLISYQGKPATLGNVADTTERRKMEEALVQSENELRFLSARLLSAEERERKRIARELHDGIGQALTAIKFSVENMLRNLSERQIDFNHTSIQNTVPLIRQTIEEVRRIIMDLRPSTLDDLGILATISWFTRELGEIYSAMTIEKKIAVSEDDIPPPLKTVIFRIMQEALNNAAKHSRAEHVIFCLEKLDNQIVLLIEDNGKGFDAEKVQSRRETTQGLGLASMRERVLLSGGVFSLKTAPGEGTSICAIWPPGAI